KSAHDISEGGLFTSLTESAMAGNLGYQIDIPNDIATDIYLFSESQGREVLSAKKESLTQITDYLNQQGIPFFRLGIVTATDIRIGTVEFGQTSEWRQIYQNVLSDILEK